MIAGQLEIQLLANMARLQSDMDKAKRTVGGTVDAMNKMLGTIGVGISVAGFASLVKSVVNAGDKLNDLRKISGLAVEQLGGLEKQAKLNGSSLDQVARAVGVMSKNMYAGADAFKVLGIQTRATDGGLRDVNSVLLDVADRFSRMEDGATKSALANQLFGKSGRDLIPMLSEGRAAIEAATASYAKNSGMTQKLAEDSDKFNDTLTLLNGRVSAVKNTFVAELLPALNNIGTAMLTATDGTNKFGAGARLLEPVLKGLAIAGYTVVDTFNGVGRSIGAAIAQAAALGKFDYQQYLAIGEELKRMNTESRTSYDKFIDTVMNGDKALEKLNAEQAKQLDLQIKLPEETDKATAAVGRQTKAFDMQVRMLKEYEKEVAGARDIEYRRLKEHEEMIKRAGQVTQSVATKQDIYNQTLEELNRLKPYLSVDTYTRALEKAERELNDVTRTSRTATDEMSQMWIQAGRNIQSSLGNMVFDFFNGGLNDMVRNAGNAVLRIVSEFAGLKMAQGLGLASMFTVPGMAGSSAGVVSAGSAALGTAGNVGTGAGIANLFKGGFGGLRSGIAGIMSGGAGSALLPIAAAFALDTASNAFAGDKTLGNGFTDFMQKIPVLGAGWDIVAGLFGRGPLKQRGTALTGMIGSEGFESGYLQTRFKANGGVFRGDKIDFARIDAITGEIWTDNKKLQGFAEDLAKVAKNTFSLINDVTKQTSKSLREIANDLGLSADGIDKFSYSINILSEKGKMLTDEQINEQIAGITDGLAHSLLPQIDDLAKRGETALQTVSRLGTEFASLVDAAAVLLGKSAADARAMILGASFEDRTGFVDKIGGPDALNQFTQLFATNFLSATERLAPAQERLNSDLLELGLSADLTREGFRSLVQSFGDVNGVSDDMLASLLKLMPAFLNVRAAQDQLAISAKNLQIRLLETQGNTGAALQLRRDMELDAADPSQRGTLREIYAAEDAAARFARVMDVLNTAQQKNIEIANQKYGLETQLLQLQGKTADLRKRELETIDPVNRALQENIWALQDQKIAADKLAETLRNNVSSAFDTLQKSVDAERKLITAQYNADLQTSSERIDSVTQSIDKLKTLADALKFAANDLAPMSVESARSQISSSILTGNLESSALLTAISTLSSSGEIFTSRIDAQRSQAKNIELLSKLGIATGAQLTLEERTLSALEAARDRLEQTYNDEMLRLDNIIVNAQLQIDALNNINNSILTIPQALGSFGAAIAAQQSAIPADIASFDVGGRVPKTGIALIHKGEQVLTKNETESMDDKLAAVKQAVDDLTRTVEVLTVAANKSKRIFEDWDARGMPAERVA